MMRKRFLVFGLLAVACFLGADVAHGCGGWCAPRCYYVISPCDCCVPACSWTCCDPCCGWSCCTCSYPIYDCCCVVANPDALDCSSCNPAKTSPAETDLKPVPENGTAPQIK